MWIGFFLLVLIVVYGNTKSIAGWDRADALVLAASVFIADATSQGLFFSLQEIPQAVRLGTMDFVMTKPVDSQFWVSTRRFNFDQLGSILAGFGMLIAGVSQFKVFPEPLQWVSYFSLIFIAVGLFYCWNMVLMTSAIWLVRVDNLFVLTESATNVARYPLDIYTGGIQKLLTYVVPFAFLASVPARQLVKGFDLQSLVLGFVWLAVAFVVARLFWRYALTQYGSASS